MANRFWVLSNEDSKAAIFRARHQAENGGTWNKGTNGWTWTSEKTEETEETPKKKRLFSRKSK